jgi:hypothetical protein
MRGSLVLTVLNATLTHDTEAFGKMDPFVIIKTNLYKEKSQIHEDGGKKPVWNQVFNIPSDKLIDILEFEVWDHDRLDDDLIGTGYISISVLTTAFEKKEETIPLKYKGKSAGELHIAFFFVSQDQPEIQPQPSPNPYPVFPGYVYPPQPYPYPSPYPPPYPQPPAENISPPLPSPQVPFENIVPPSDPLIPPCPAPGPAEFVVPSPIPPPPCPPPPANDESNVIFNLVNQDSKEYDIIEVFQFEKKGLQGVQVKAEGKDAQWGCDEHNCSWVEAAVSVKENGNIIARTILFENYHLIEWTLHQFFLNDPSFMKYVKMEGTDFLIIARSRAGSQCHVRNLVVKPTYLVEEQVEDSEIFGKTEILHGHDNMNQIYFSHEVKAYDRGRKVKSVVFEGSSKDQGWASVSDSSSWLEAGVIINESEVCSRVPLFKNYCLENFKEWETKIESEDFMAALSQKGARLVVWARSEYPGWICSVEYCKAKLNYY